MIIETIFMTTMYLNRNCSFFNDILSSLGIEKVENINIFVFEGGGKFVTYYRHIVTRLTNKASLTEDQKQKLCTLLENIPKKKKIELHAEEVEYVIDAFS